ncbi:hypothetical protein F5B19DRAFT_500585 [Rostrohypoxylon terebratum]|nr:hypothetical protein F5B19DRAFT_500585 [Rostrohypoxylon terebratum]
MDHSKNANYRKSCAGAFGRLPTETIQKIMSYLDFESLQSLVLLSSHFYHIFKGAEKLILYPVMRDQLGPDIFPIAVLRYACSRIDLRVDVEKVTSRIPIPKPAIMLRFNQHELYIDVERCQIPKHIFTPAIAFTIYSYQRMTQKQEKEREEWVAEQPQWYAHVGKSVTFHPSDGHQIRLATYVVDSVRLLFPGEMDPTRDTRIIYIDREKEERIIIHTRPQRLQFDIIMEPRLNNSFLILSQ